MKKSESIEESVKRLSELMVKFSNHLVELEAQVSSGNDKFKKFEEALEGLKSSRSEQLEGEPDNLPNNEENVATDEEIDKSQNDLISQLQAQIKQQEEMINSQKAENNRLIAQLDKTEPGLNLNIDKVSKAIEKAPF